jgi:hypothetical protein
VSSLPFWPSLEQALGVLLFVAVLLDVFLTVLYARIGTGVLSNGIGRLTWRAARWLARRVDREHPGTALSFAGPVVLVLLVGAWALVLTCGMGMILHPYLGAEVRAKDGAMPNDFVTAMYAGGSSVAILGSSDLAPQTGALRLLYLFNSLVGASVVSLSLAYLVQVYSALRARNSLALKIHLLGHEEADATYIAAGLAADGQFTGGYSQLQELAADMTKVTESHHFYPVLFYFRFPEPRYAVSRFSLIALDAVTIIESALDRVRYSYVTESSPVDQLRRTTTLLLSMLDQSFLCPSERQSQEEPDAATKDRWRRRYRVALQVIRAAGLTTVADESAGAEKYVSLRARWDCYIRSLAPHMGYRQEEIDPVGYGLTPGREDGAVVASRHVDEADGRRRREEPERGGVDRAHAPGRELP